MWLKFTHEGGTGFYWKIISSVYHDEELWLEGTTFARALNQFKLHEADIMLAIYRTDIDGDDYLRSDSYIDVDYVSVCIRNTSVFPSIDSLKDGVATWVVDYGYEAIFDVKDYYEVEERAKGLQMVAKGRVDFYIDAFSEITRQLDNDAALKAQLTCNIIHEEPLYLAFHNNPRGRTLQNKWEQRFKQLREDNRLQVLFTKYGVPYPFNYHQIIKSPAQ